MRIRLAKKGAPSKETRKLISEFNDWLDNASEEQKLKYGKDYSNVDEIQNAYTEATGNKYDGFKSSESMSENDFFEEANADIEKTDTFKVSNEIPDGFDFDPNISPLTEKPYAKEIIDPTMQQTVGEPLFSTEPISIPNPEQPSAQPQSTSGASTSSASDVETPPNTDSLAGISNPAMNELGEKEKRIAASQTVDMVLAFYENAHQWVKGIAKVNETKIIELERKGLIDPTDTLPVDHDGTKITARELVHGTNQAIDEVLTPDPTFSGKVREPMIREFSKRGWALTDMQYIMIAFGQDIATKTAMIVGVRKNMSSILDIYKEQQKERKSFEREKVNSVEPDSIASNVQEPVMETESVY